MVCKDLPRLARRMTIFTFPLSVEIKLQSDPPEQTDEHGQPVGPVRKQSSNTQQGLIWASVINVIKTVAYAIEEPERVQAIVEGLAATKRMADLEMTLERVFEEVIGWESKTARVFRATHQSIIFPPAAYLREHVFDERVGMMKDVRRPDGWVIGIHLGDQGHAIYHTRWEQSLHPQDDPQHFEVQWEIRINFDKNLEDVKAVMLRIVNLNFHPLMPKERREELKEVLHGDGFLV